jgi:hypothetical protein
MNSKKAAVDDCIFRHNFEKDKHFQNVMVLSEVWGRVATKVGRKQENLFRPLITIP